MEHNIRLMDFVTSKCMNIPIDRSPILKLCHPSKRHAFPICKKNNKENGIQSSSEVSLGGGLYVDLKLVWKLYIRSLFHREKTQVRLKNTKVQTFIPQSIS